MPRALDGTVRKATEEKTAMQSQSAREEHQIDTQIPIPPTPEQERSFKCDFSCHWPERKKKKKKNTVFTLLSFVAEVFR